jgi:N-acetylglucosaminyldiphosphoundecaprenol N-acetyl-beta-D-mannosaminyltransferase
MMQAERAAQTEQGRRPLEPATAPVKETVLFDVRFSNISFEELCRWLGEHIQRQTPAYIVTPNVDHVCRLRFDADFREAYASAALRLPDGVPLMWCSKLLGKPLREKLSGSDLVPRLSAYAAEKGYRVFFFGAAEGVAEEAARRLREKYPGLQVAGFYSPPMNFDQDATQNQEAVQRVRATQADICFVALGSPKQEIWLLHNTSALGVPLAVGIGASLDFAAGRVRRAPLWVQRIGCEWIWRLVREPRRLWRRYLVEDSYFFILLFKELVRRWTVNSEDGAEL